MSEARERRAPDRPEPVSPFYIPASPSTPAYAGRTLKHRDSFLVVDPHGDAQATGPAAEGLFHQDTRFLSQFAFLFRGARPLLLSSTVTEDNVQLAIDLTNADLFVDGALRLPRDSIHILRTKVLAEGACFEAVHIRNFALIAVELDIAFRFAADFADIFEVRGQHRARRGALAEESVGEGTVVLGYRGLDRVMRRTHLDFAPHPRTLARHAAHYSLSLEPGAETTLFVTVRCETEGKLAARDMSFRDCLQAAEVETRRRQASQLRIESSNVAFNHWIDRSRADLDMLVTDTPEGPYPYAGIPWFSTVFGRDGIIAALQCLWADPAPARGVLRFLAAHQAQSLDPANDAEPGKILHEMRRGEMAALREVPFGCYYGSADSTPLFVMLAAAYYQRTGDLDLIRAIMPNIEAALGWMRDYGDPDHDGFLEYDRRAEGGLINQGWKDSSDSIFHADGRLAAPPVALVEVQAYAYASFRGAAGLARALDDGRLAAALEAEAVALRRRFEQHFWCEEIGTYALALDGAKRPCRVRSSNAGHALLAGIASPAHGARVAATLMDGAAFSGWGIRTIAASEARYNPMSYHNGSIWPHDNGLIAMGFARYGFREPLIKVLGGLFDAASALEMHRLPELYCGFARRRGEGPTGYPVACAPQAWASASAFALIGAALGVSFHPADRQIRFTRPTLPPFLDELRLRRLRMADVAVDLVFRRHGRDASLHVLRKEGEAEIVMISG